MRKSISWCRALVLWLMSAVVLSVTGCSGCQTEGVCPDEVSCSGLEQCIDGQCVLLLDLVCIPSCGDGQVCSQGQCIDGVKTCTQGGQRCDPFSPISGDFYCVDWDGLASGQPAVCSNPCSPQGECPAGEACYVLTGLNDTPCADQSACGLGRICLNGQCRAAACQPSECDGALSGIEGCRALHAQDPAYPNGAACVIGDDGTKQCVPAGLQGLGEFCVSQEQAAQTGNYEQTCRQGQRCVLGLCRKMCDDDALCNQDQSCLFAQDNLIDEGVGFCGVSCTPFTQGECGQGQKCLPISAQQGYCVPAGPSKAFEACLPNSFNCEEGTSCVSYNNEQARCLPLCNLTVAPPQGSTTLTAADQLQRDTTCPQPQIPTFSFVSLVHLAQRAGVVDVYVDGQSPPWVSGLSFEQRASAQQQEAYLTLSPGAHVISILPAQSSPIEPPLAELQVALNRDEAYLLVLGASPPSSAQALKPFISPVERELAQGVRVVDALGDGPAVDVIARDGGQKIVLAQGLTQGRLGDPVSVQAGEYAVEVWAQGTVDEPEQAPLFVRAQVQLGVSAQEELYLRGTIDPDDGLAQAGVSTLIASAIPEPVLGPPLLTCQPLANGVYGYCEEVCDGPRAYAQEVCQGQGMSCAPVRRDGFLGFASLCRPAGRAGLGEPCVPNQSPSACGPNLYCLEFGNTAADFSPSQPRGRCQPLCVVDDAEDETLRCQPGQACQALDASFEIGQCGYACEPSPSYGDADCPAGLGSCKPRASATTVAGPNGESIPAVEPLPPFCSASGNITPGVNCGGADCVPGTECLYPRSAQQDLVTTILSPYFGAIGQVPTCRPICDPFDGDSAAVRCGPNETCLVNYPWSAEVGHCAPIVERIQPFQPCSRPGESCGPDSVCVVDGGASFCLRLCEYVGGPSEGIYAQSTCSLGFACAPLVDDIGFCQAL